MTVVSENILKRKTIWKNF